MNAVAERPAIRTSRRIPATMQPTSESSGTNYTMGLLAAVGVHVLILFGLRGAPPAFEQVEFAVEVAEASVEVTLVAALPAEESAPEVEPPPPEPEPEPLPPPPEPVPAPVEPPPPPEKPPEMTLPEPAPPPPVPRRIEPPRVQKSQPKVQPAPRPVRPVGDGSSPIPGNDATTAKAAAGAASAKPGYLSNPHPAYPEAARVARQQGVVSLRINVDADGRVTGVRITRSSGFPLLDERAQSTVSQRWRFKPARAGGVPVATEVVVPIRFTLDR